jgi:hypothetical protein
MKLVLLLLAFAVSAVAVGQSAPQAVLTWNAPTTYTDNTAIPSTVAITYNVYQGNTATSLAKVASVTALTDTITTGLRDGTTYYWSVTAVVNGNESAQVTPVSKAFAAGTPGSVITLTVK